MAIISMIVAMANDNVIGVDNTLPWRLSADLKRFKMITMGKPVIMGRKTWDSIGRPLPGRLNIVITRTQSLNLDGAEVVNSLEAAIELASKQGKEELMIIGGANVYEQAFPCADRLYVTKIDMEIKGDAWFPYFDTKKWKLLAKKEQHQEALQGQPAFSYVFEDWQRDA